MWSKRLRRFAVPLQRLVRLFRWESWDTSMNLHLIPTVTFWRHHSDDWDEDCLLRVRREVRIGVEWLFWDKSWRVWHREWRDEEARERFTDDANNDFPRPPRASRSSCRPDGRQPGQRFAAVGGGALLRCARGGK